MDTRNKFGIYNIDSRSSQPFAGWAGCSEVIPSVLQLCSEKLALVKSVYTLRIYTVSIKKAQIKLVEQTKLHFYWSALCAVTNALWCVGWNILVSRDWNNCGVNWVNFDSAKINK